MFKKKFNLPASKIIELFNVPLDDFKAKLYKIVKDKAILFATGNISGLGKLLINDFCQVE